MTTNVYLSCQNLQEQLLNSSSIVHDAPKCIHTFAKYVSDISHGCNMVVPIRLMSFILIAMKGLENGQCNIETTIKVPTDICTDDIICNWEHFLKLVESISDHDFSKEFRHMSEVLLKKA